MSAQAGQLLVASRRLTDPNFIKTVVLIVQHDKSGVIGLVLNRPLELKVSDSVGSEIDVATGVDAHVHQGGPCSGPLMVLHNDALAGGDEILPGVRFAVQREQIEKLMRETHGKIKYFAGYAGWAAEQLDGELEEGAWLIADATDDDVFADAGESQWSELMTRLTLGQWIDPAKMPDDPSVN